MASYTVHLPPEGEENQRLLKAAFIKDGFSRGAFSFGLFWLASRRLWVSALLFALFFIGLITLVVRQGLPFWAFGTISFLTLVLLALEGASLQRWRLKRRGWQEAGVVVARNQEEAEWRFFASLHQDQKSDEWAPASGSAAVATTLSAKPSDVIGLFPQPGARG
jgi:hypothetical protein